MMEGLGIVMILLHFVLIKKIYLVGDPFSSVFIPLWALVAYLIISLRRESQHLLYQTLPV